MSVDQKFVEATHIGGTEKCDGCSLEFPLSEIEFGGKTFLCAACRAVEAIRETPAARWGERQFHFTVAGR